MKTEPTEAYEAVKYYEANNINIDAFRAKKLCDMAFYEGQSSPKIKQLEWTDHLRHYFVDTPFGVYLILKNHNFEENESWTLYFNAYVIDEYVDSDKAQEVAQADFERRAMECLDL